jgi:NADH-quinone oxidoreductase subunit J
MTLYALLFYVLAVLLVASTAMAVTRQNMVHAVLYLVMSFFGSAMLFYLLGAPFLAALEIIIYAGAIMVLFLFIIMMIRVEKMKRLDLNRQQMVPAAILALGFLSAFGLLLKNDSSGWQPLMAAQAAPKIFGRYLFETHWLAIEIASLLLLAALIGAYLLGRQIRRSPGGGKETP